MKIIYYSEENRGSEILSDSEPMLAIINHNGDEAVVGLLDEGVEHHILLNKALHKMNIDQYFRIVFDEDGVDWTFVCPMGYKGIINKEKRIQSFYNDGLKIIRQFLNEIGFKDITIGIPKRYRRHINYMGNIEF